MRILARLRTLTYVRIISASSRIRTYFSFLATSLASPGLVRTRTRVLVKFGLGPDLPDPDRVGGKFELPSRIVQH